VLIPLYGFLRGDTLGLVLLVHDDQTIADVAACMQQAAAPRVAPVEHVAVYFAGRQLALEATVASAGLQPLDRVDIVPREPQT
jgi:hypothetical protein